MLSHPIDISIVVPFYNGERFLPRLVESIVASHKASSGDIFIELIIVVDSMESDLSLLSLMVVQAVGDNANILPVIRKNELNLGVAQSRNIGQRLSSGKFIAFIDQDDYIAKPYFSVLEKNLNADVDFFVLNGSIEFEKQKIHRPVFYFPVRLSFDKIARVNMLITPGLLIFNRTRANCNFRQFSSKHAGSDDWACYLELLSNTHLKFQYVNEKLIHYVVHNENYHQNKSNFIISQLRTIQYFHRMFPENISVRIKLSSLQFRLKRHLSLIKFSKLTLSDITGFFSFIFIELFIIHNLIWLIWSKCISLHNNRLGPDNK